MTADNQQPATPEWTREFFPQVDALCAMFLKDVGMLAAEGSLNEAQLARCDFLIDSIVGMRALFQKEAAEQGCGPAEPSLLKENLPSKE